jgi:prepilin peptidase CpaA
MPTLIRFAPLFMLLAIGALVDLRERRIPNWLTMCIAIAGIAQSFMAYHTVSPLQSMAGLGIGFVLPLILLFLNAIGAGDVKLLAAVGAWVGPVNIIIIFIAKDLIGLVMVLAQATAQGRLRTLVRNSTVVALNLVHVREVGLDTVQQCGLSSRSIDKPLPMAVPILIAIVLLLLVRPGGF